VTRLVLAITSCWVLLVGCGASSKPAEAPARGPDVLIPDVTEEQSKKSSDDTPAPTGTRSSLPGESPYYDGPEPGSPDDPWSSYGTTGRGGPDCDRAADCCLRFYAASGSDPSAQRVCHSFRIAPSTVCANMLSSFQQMAPSAGVQCY
jgi:hypothetical protein